MKWDLSSISKDANITSAILKIYKLADMTGSSSLHQTCNFNFHKMKQDWSIDNTDYDDFQDAYYEEIDAVYESTEGAKKWLEIDITDMIKDFVAEKIPNYGFLIDCDASIENNNTGQGSIYLGWNVCHSSSNMYVDKTPELHITISESGITEQQNTASCIKLMRNYPNPFNPSTNISFYLQNSTNVNLSIFNMAGEKVISLIDGYLNSGNHSVQFNGNNLNSGVYFYTLQTPYSNLHGKMLLIK